MKPKYSAFSALDPFFEVVQRGLSGLVEGEHYFDTIAKNAIFEFRYDIGGWPKRVESRDALMALNTLAGGPSKLFEASYAQVWEAIRALVKRAVKSGDIRKDLDPIDLLRALVVCRQCRARP
jgi:hypothetical protein